MTNEFKLYKVLPKYINALRDETNGGDSTIYRVDGKESRPFVGIVAVINGYNYFVPLTSYKPRFHYLTNKEPDFMPIYRCGKMVSALEFNKMIPVPLNQIRPLDTEIRKHDPEGRRQAKELRIYEEIWCNNHAKEIKSKALLLYKLYAEKDESYKNIKYCIDFKQIEILCSEYEKQHPAQHK